MVFRELHKRQANEDSQETFSGIDDANGATHLAAEGVGHAHVLIAQPRYIFTFQQASGDIGGG